MDPRKSSAYSGHTVVRILVFSSIRVGGRRRIKSSIESNASSIVKVSELVSVTTAYSEDTGMSIQKDEDGFITAVKPAATTPEDAPTSTPNEQSDGQGTLGSRP